MSKLPSLTPQDIIKILEKRGFILDRSKGSHRIYYHPETKRRVVVPYLKYSNKLELEKTRFSNLNEKVGTLDLALML